MEVSINKILVTMTDLKNAVDGGNQRASNGVTEDKIQCEVPKGFKEPDLPLGTLSQLITLKRNLENAEFRLFLVCVFLHINLKS